MSLIEEVEGLTTKPRLGRLAEHRTPPRYMLGLDCVGVGSVFCAKSKRIDTSSVNRSIFAPSPTTSSDMLIPNRLGRVRRVGGTLDAVEDDSRADRDDGRRNASGDEDAHWPNSLVPTL